MGLVAYTTSCSLFVPFLERHDAEFACFRVGFVCGRQDKRFRELQLQLFCVSGKHNCCFLRIVFVSGGTYEKRNGMKEPDHFGETVSAANASVIATRFELNKLLKQLDAMCTTI